jgi:CheY-like chemotaxis protein
VWNLLSNAVKFTPRGGKAQVALMRVNSHVEISVTDTGAGFMPDFAPHLFERFRQADASTTRRHGGLGLGLSIVKHLVELHGGSVAAHSAGPNQGATFTVKLPLVAVRREESGARVHPTAPATAVTSFDHLDLSGIRAMVVDDEADGRDLVSRVLSNCGAQVVEAASASEALLRLGQSDIDVLISDIGMPEMDGYELLREVRRLEATSGRKMPAVALTAFARSEDRTRALHAGFHVHVSKPVEAAELIATVASVTGRV